MSMEMPYFMTNPKWYKEKWVGSDTDGGVEYELTSEAPPKAVESFNDEKEQMYILAEGAPQEAVKSYFDYLAGAMTKQY